MTHDDEHQILEHRERAVAERAEKAELKPLEYALHTKRTWAWGLREQIVKRGMAAKGITQAQYHGLLVALKGLDGFLARTDPVGEPVASAHAIAAVSITLVSGAADAPAQLPSGGIEIHLQGSNGR